MITYGGRENHNKMKYVAGTCENTQGVTYQHIRVALCPLLPKWKTY